MAPKGIACSRVLPKTHTDIYITNTTKKTKMKYKIIDKLQQRKQKQNYKTKTNYRQFTKKLNIEKTGYSACRNLCALKVNISYGTVFHKNTVFTKKKINKN